MNNSKLPLSPRQRDIYEFLRDRIQSENRPPTVREICERFDIHSTNCVHEMLVALEKKGYIRRTPFLSRAIELADAVPTAVETIPVVGRVAAGLPLLAVENIDGHVAVDRSFLPAGEVFSLRVAGESMKDEGIKDGDMVLVKKQDNAQKGQIVVAVIGEEATVKKFYPERGRVRLEPANSAFGSIVVDRNAPGFFIAGVVVGLLRRM
ncbi:MAG: transcriptional repressor LexA [Candidatus Zixiibacteriota bacterium]